VLIDRALEPDAPFEREHCGTCRRCLDACPTGAIVEPGRVDARLCISYLTIEHRGAIARELRPRIGDWIFGCDVCQDVCPWNRFAPPAREARLHARSLDGWSLERFLALDEAGFRELFATSPIRRAKRGGFLRNVCIALGNRGERSSLPALRGALADSDPLVRGHAAWALGAIAAQLADDDPARRETRDDLAGRLSDPAPFVREEAQAALDFMVPAA
jgi:epoxyqueuosine reductase